MPQGISTPDSKFRSLGAASVGKLHPGALGALASACLEAVTHGFGRLLNHQKGGFFQRMTPDVFRAEAAALWAQYRSSKHPFFSRLQSLPTAVAHSPVLLEELYKRYQGAMHASRAMAYRMPHLDAIDLRMTKFRVLADDDGAPNGDSHHYQLRRTWTEMLGRAPTMTDDDFGDLDQLRKVLDPATARFVALCQELFPHSLGPWIMVEGLAHDWIGALQNSLLPHFPGLEKSDYFRENYASRVEIEHAKESLDTTLRVLSKRPELTADTLGDAVKIGEGLNIFWTGMEELLSSFPDR